MRTRLTVLTDGTRVSCELVFCELERRSVLVSRCEACPFAAATSRETVGSGVVDCGRSILPVAGSAADSTFPPAIAATLPVGLALWWPVVCLESDLPWIDGTRAPVLREGHWGVPIVDHGGALVGVLPATAVTLKGRGAPVDLAESVGARAVSAPSVHEGESLGEAFATMGLHRARELTVVSDGLEVVGVLRDVDALHFVAHVARTGTRPVPQRAA